MFSFLKKDPASKLKKEYAALLERALEAQRRGDIRSYSELSSEADEVANKLEQLGIGK